MADKEVSNALDSANLMQGLMTQIYDIFTKGGDVANPSEDNFFCWLTPGIPITPEQFDFATEGLSGIVRPRTSPQEQAPEKAETTEDAVDNAVNRIIRKRVEEIASYQMAVETDETKLTEEEKQRRAEELEALKAKEADQQDTDPNLGALKELGSREAEEEEEEFPEQGEILMHRAFDSGYTSQDEEENEEEESEYRVEDRIPVNDADAEGYEETYAEPEINALSEEDFEALKAERTTLLYMQAENFAHMVNFIPDMSGLDRTGFATLENEGSLLDVYKKVLTMSEVAQFELDEKTQAKLAKARSLLTKTVMKATDLLSDEKEPVEVDGPIVEAYNAKMAAYYDAYLEYNNHRLAALAGDDPKAVHDWAMNGQFYFNKVRAAMNAWVTQGYKNDYEQINAFIANVTERDLSLLKAQYKEILQRSMMTGLVSGLEFPFTTISPANFAQASGWTEFTFNTRHYKDHSDSQVNNHSLKVDQTSTSWFHKQHYMYGKEEPYQEMDMGAELANLDISFKICQVNIVRPWFKPSFLASKSWRFAPGSEDGRKGTLLSTGGPRPEGILPAYPTAMLVVKDVVFDFHDTQVASNFKHKYDQVSHDGGLGVSVGFFGIGARGNVGVLDNKKHDGNENGIIQNKSKVTIPGMQVIGYRCHMLDKSPDPLPSIKEWA